MAAQPCNIHLFCGTLRADCNKSTDIITNCQLTPTLLQVHMPKSGRGQSLIEFLKRGPLTQDEAKAVARAMRAANTIESADAGLQVSLSSLTLAQADLGYVNSGVSSVRLDSKRSLMC